MNENFLKLTEIYEKIYDVNAKIASAISQGQLEEIGSLLDNKDSLIQEGTQIIKNSNFSEKEKDEIDQIIQKIRTLEEQNLKSLQNKQSEIKKELSNINKNSKVLSAYKFNKESEPMIIDDRD